jgi:hypothetical protein
MENIKDNALLFNKLISRGPLYMIFNRLSWADLTNLYLTGICSSRVIRYVNSFGLDIYKKRFIYSNLYLTKMATDFDIVSPYQIIECGCSIEVFKWLQTNYNLHIDNSKVLKYACSSGNIRLVKWLFTAGYNYQRTDMIYQACKSIKFTTSKNLYQLIEFCESKDYDITPCCIGAALRHMRFDVAEKLSLNIDDKWFNDYNIIARKIFKDGKTFKEVVEVLEWMIHNKLPTVNGMLCGLVEYYNQVETSEIIKILSWVYNKRGKRDFESNCYNGAMLNGNITIAKYLYSIGVKPDSICFIIALESGNLEIADWLVSVKCHRNKKHIWHSKCKDVKTQLRVLNWIKKHNFPKPRTISVLAGCDIKILDWLWNHDFKLDSETLWYALESGKMENLIWLHNKQCPIDFRSLLGAIATENIKIVQWMLKAVHQEPVETIGIYEHMIEKSTRSNIDKLIKIAQLFAEYGIKMEKSDLWFTYIIYKDIIKKWEQFYIKQSIN